MSADIAIAQFRFLERLLLVHGHWCYRRISMMVNFSSLRIIKDFYLVHRLYSEESIYSLDFNVLSMSYLCSSFLIKEVQF